MRILYLRMSAVLGICRVNERDEWREKGKGNKSVKIGKLNRKCLAYFPLRIFVGNKYLLTIIFMHIMYVHVLEEVRISVHS